MTSKNLNCRVNKPFLLAPAGKDYLWGGTRLKEAYGKHLPMEPLAESWECSVHPDGVSLVASGAYQGKSLSQVLLEHPEFLGTHPASTNGGEMPILIKLIDAKEDLSIQVHPDDAYAHIYENGSLGKTEMWYVLEANPDAHLIYGFHRDITREELQKSLEQGNIEKYLQKIPVHKDDVFFIEPGCIHAIGAGVVIAEIQESSNVTYRLFDYHRVDKNGKARELHLEKGLAVANLKSSAEPRQPLRVLRYRKGYATELLGRCRYFQVERMLVNTKDYNPVAELQTGSNSFKVLLCTEGAGRMAVTGEEELPFGKGDCIFIPASSVMLQLQGKAQFLMTSC